MRNFFIALIAVCLTIGFAPAAKAVDIDISGAIEVEIGSVDDGSANSEDIVTATMALGFDAQVADQVEGHVVLLFEEDDTEPIAVDEAFIVLNPTEQFFIQAGLYVVPFGSYDALVLSDPLTLDIGETGQTAITLGFKTGAFTVQAGTFNGDVWDSGETEETISIFYAAAGYSAEYDMGLSVDAGVSWISSIADSDGLGDVVATTTASGDPVVDSFVAGYAANVKVGYGMFTLIGEYVSAASSFEASDFGTADEVTPLAYNLEFGADLNDKFSVAARYGGSEDMGDVIFETVMAGAVSYALYDNTTLAAEYLTGSYDDDTGVDDVSALTFKLAVEF